MTPDEIAAERERFEDLFHSPHQYEQFDANGMTRWDHAKDGWDARAEIARAEQAELRAENERLRGYGIELLQLKFEEYSEARYFATWHDGIELAIWQAAANGDTWAQKIVECAEVLGVWLEWIDGENGPTPVPLAEWRARMGGVG